MFYIKTHISDNVEIKVDICDDEIFTQCYECGKEVQVEREMLKKILEDGDLVNSSLYCKECSKGVI